MISRSCWKVSVPTPALQSVRAGRLPGVMTLSLNYLSSLGFKALCFQQSLDSSLEFLPVIYEFYIYI